MYVVDTSDRDAAADAVGQSFPGIDLAADPDDESFRLYLSRQTRGLATYSRMNIRGTVRSTGLYPDEFAVGRLLSGALSLEYGPDSLATSRPYLRPRAESSAHFENSRVELISLDPERFRQLASRYLEGSGQRILSPTVDRSAPVADGATLWEGTAHTIARHLDASELQWSIVEDLLVTSLLIAFPLTTGASNPDPENVLPRAIQRATAYIQEHLAEPIAMPQVADAARTSVRSLQGGFLRHLATTPTRYLRELRLRAAHADLLDSDPGATTVAAIAQRWGFSHLGRFAGEYRGRYGESPSDTLRR